MKIVVADLIVLQLGYHKELEDIGDPKVCNTWPVSDEDYAEKVKDANIATGGRHPFPAKAFERAQNLQMLAVFEEEYLFQKT